MADTNGDGIDDQTGQPVTPSTGAVAPFDPSVPTGYATNLTAQAAQQAQQDPSLFVGWSHSNVMVPNGGGKYAADNGIPFEPGHDQSVRNPIFVPLSQLVDAFDNFGRDDFLHLRNLLIAAGLVSPNADPGTVRNAYVGILGQVADKMSQGIRMSPMGLIKNYVRMNGFDPSKIGSSPDFFGDGTDPNRTVTTVQKNVTDITEGQAFASLQSNLSQMLGRDPSDQETRDFLYRMNHLAAQNPSISKTVYRYKNGEQVSVSTHTDPGFNSADVQQAAYDQAQNEPDYAEYRGASYLFNAVLGALGPIGG